MIDNILVNLAYVVVCAVLGWRIGSIDHLWLIVVIDVVYHFACETNNGQTIGKRQYGLRVVTADDGDADPQAIAIRSVLRIVDTLPVWYVSGLVSMVRTGPARRQRIGDVAAHTKVVAVEGRALGRGTPGWMLPSATILALLMSAVSTFGIAHGDSRPSTVRDRAVFMTGCERSSAGSPAECGCILARLEAEGYTAPGALQRLVDKERRDAATRTLSIDSRNLLGAIYGCRASTPAAPGPLA
ncbi:MAG: RDD family protein [Solirubrobacteraceae bacterium]